MDIHSDVSLKDYVTMKIGGKARLMVDAYTVEDLLAVYEKAKQESLPIFVLGEGSNVIVKDEGFDGIVMRVRIPGFTVLNDDDSSTTIKIGAGENWDLVVEKTVNMKLSGIEAMSGIPGTAGATPVQNVGAYGQEIAETLQSLEAYDSETEKVVVLENTECGFSYRNSIFRESAKGRYVIVSITLKLSKSSPKPPFYEALQRYLDEHNITEFTPATIREAVLNIRKDKLPDPKQIPNTGSFFKNAIVSDDQLKSLTVNYPSIPSYEMGDGRYKIPTGWLIEQTGLKGQVLHGMKIHDKNALVLINQSANSYNDLAQAREEITKKVRDQFNIEIEQEPLEI